MKHAYLIIAHNEFEVLRQLISTLDDNRNDIFIHVDKKVKQLPVLSVQYAKLHLLEKRYDVRWGHTSQMSAMLMLFGEALSTGSYMFYHLISGVHLPLQTQDDLHEFFNAQRSNNFVMEMSTSDKEVDLKMRRYHFFIRNFIHRNKIFQCTDQFFWLVFIKIQQYLGIKRYKRLIFKKASQWCSLNQEAVRYLVENTDQIRLKYKMTFCCDEFFVRTELARSPLRHTVIDLPNLLQCDFVGISPKVYTGADAGELIDSGFLFARKFSGIEMSTVETIINHITKRR